MTSARNSLQRVMSSMAAALGILLLPAGSAEAAGMLFFTQNGSPYVTAVQYVSFSQRSAHLSYITTRDGKRVQIQTAGIVGQIPFPDPNIPVSSVEAAGFIAQAELLAARYPQYAELLNRMGDLWRKNLENDASSHFASANVAVPKSEPNKNIASNGALSEIPVLKTKSGESLKAVKITRFEDDYAVVMHSTGMCRVHLPDIANISGLPPDVKMAIEKADKAKLTAQDGAGKKDSQPMNSNFVGKPESSRSESAGATLQKIIITQGSKTAIPSIRLKSGKFFSNAVINRFENEEAIIIHEGGETRVALSDIIDPGSLPQDVKIAIIKAQVAFSTR